MCDMLYTQLENEQNTRAALLATGRTDIIASMLLKRIEAEIIELERKINDQGQKDIERRATGGAMAAVFKTLYRHGYFKNRRHNPLLEISENAQQQMPEAAR